MTSLEIVAPAGNIQKLAYAYAYGADTAYIGLKKFSLRVKADNFYEDEYRRITDILHRYNSRPETVSGAERKKRLFCALNISFHNSDLDNFLADIGYFKQYPIDAFIIQDLGMVKILQKHFPQAALHLSTQANCINKEAVKMYRDMGFKRIVTGREASLADIRAIKDAVPDMEIESFAHGAMCIAYSGRCLLSAYMTGRSANAGSCTHSCRWDWRVKGNEPADDVVYLEEKERRGEYFPAIAGEDFTSILSSKDLCMIDHLDDMKNAGVDSIKIEGRMKSLYYVAMVTRAYKKAVQLADNTLTPEEALPFIAELDKVAHREFSTGFYYSREDADKTTSGQTGAEYTLMGTIGRQINATDWEFLPMNKMDAGLPLEYVGPEVLFIKDDNYKLIDPQDGSERSWICHGHDCILRTGKPLQEGFIVRAHCRTGNLPDTAAPASK